MDLTQVTDTLARWDLATQKAALIHGPRQASEALCERIFGASDTLDVRAFRALMATSIKERAEHAPLNCLLVQWFSGELASGGEDALTDEVAQYWADMKVFETEPGQNAFVINNLRQEGRLPAANVEFVRWLRRCATRSQDIAWLSCVSAMRELAPRHGRDVLEVAELHLVDRPDPTSPLPGEQLLEVVGLLTTLGKQGQPESWRIEEHDALLNYDYDLRLASIFELCRFTMSNDRLIADAAAEGISKITTMQLMITDMGLFRIRDTCRIAFGGNEHDLEIASLPVLATNDVSELKVLRSALTDTPRYEFADLMERGECVFEQGYPLWYCGARLWKGKRSDIAEDLKHAFINTRYVEWAPREDVPALDSGLVWQAPTPEPGALVEPEVLVDP
jgi:hypothetical protein